MANLDSTAAPKKSERFPIELFSSYKYRNQHAESRQPYRGCLECARNAGPQHSTLPLFPFFSTLVLYTECKIGANGGTFVVRAMLVPPLVLEDVVLRFRR